MLPYIHYPVLFDFGFFKIYTWGFIVALGFLFSILLAKKYSKISKNHIYNIGFWAVVGGIVGGRLLYFAYNPSKFGFYNLFKVWDGGMSIFGGFILASLFILIYLKRNKLNILRTLDELVPWLVFGLIIGRIACLLGDGGHLGKRTEFFLAVAYPHVGYHLTALYSFFALVVLGFLIWNLKQFKFRKGFFISLFLVYYGFTRFIIDFFRDDAVYFGLTIAQYLSIIMLIIGIIIWRKAK